MKKIYQIERLNSDCMKEKTEIKDVVAKINTCSIFTVLGGVILDETGKMLGLKERIGGNKNDESNIGH